MKIYIPESFITGNSIGWLISSFVKQTDEEKTQCIAEAEARLEAYKLENKIAEYANLYTNLNYIKPFE